MPSRCDARRKSGQPCCAYAVRGATKCRMHLGKRAADVIAVHEAAKAVAAYGLPVDTNPVDALLDEVRWTAGHVAWLRERVQEVEQAALVWGKTEQVVKGSGEFTGTDTTSAARPNVWLDLYQRERKHLVDVCKTAITAGIEERKVRLAEQHGEIIVGLIRAILDDLGLSAEQLARSREVVPRRLRALAA